MSTPTPGRRQERRDRHGWRLRAACLGQPVELFFPMVRDAQGVIDTWCRPCPVRAECLDDELERPKTQRNGARGGVAWVTGASGRRGIRDPYGYLPEDER